METKTQYKQIDMLVEASDRLATAGNEMLEQVTKDLPSKPWLTPPDVASALDMKCDTVYRWIQSGSFGYMDLGSGPDGKPRYKIHRESFLAFLKSRINRP